MSNVILFPHCPKTGGTVLKERYINQNNEFAITDLNHKVDQNTKVIFGHNLKIGHYENILKNKCIYITCLRHPISRIMSMYNFYRTQLFYLNPDSNDIDFYLWFINKDVIRPMFVSKQFEYFLYQHIDHVSWFEDNTLADPFHTNDMYLNTMLSWNVESDKTSVDHNKLEQAIKHKQQVEDQNMNITWDRIVSNFDHVFFQHEDIVNIFDNLLIEYDMQMQPWEDMIVTNETKHDLDKHNLEYVNFYNLDDDLKYLVELDLKADIEFYERCENKWKH